MKALLVRVSAIAVFGVIAFFLGYSADHFYWVSDTGETRAALPFIARAVAAYQEGTGKCPAAISDLEPRYLTKVFVDPWGHSFTVSCSDDLVSVASVGMDGTLGSHDDISYMCRVPCS